MSREDAPAPVGYKRPPQHSQFKKGQSGNPSGRRKGKPRLSLIDELDKVLAEPIFLTRNGKSKAISRLAAVLHKLVDCALKNDTRAMALIFKLIAKYQLAADQPLETPTGEQDQAMIRAALARLMQTIGGHDA